MPQYYCVSTETFKTQLFISAAPFKTPPNVAYNGPWRRRAASCHERRFDATETQEKKSHSQTRPGFFAPSSPLAPILPIIVLPKPPRHSLSYRPFLRRTFWSLRSLQDHRKKPRAPPKHKRPSQPSFPKQPGDEYPLRGNPSPGCPYRSGICPAPPPPVGNPSYFARPWPPNPPAQRTQAAMRRRPV
jgi:hypothetical protein